MTTICTDGRSMAADGLISDRGTVVSRTAVKMERLNDGRVAGFAGPTCLQLATFDWLNNDGPRPRVGDDDGMNVLILYPSGEVAVMDWRLELAFLDAPAAIGSGMDLAIGAMEMGASPARAIAVASRRDCHTGGEITEIWPVATVQERAA